MAPSFAAAGCSPVDKFGKDDKLEHMGKVDKYGKDEKLTTSEVADLLGVTRVSIRNYRVASYLPAEESKHGLRTVYRFSLADVIQFAAERLNRTITADDLERVRGSSDDKEDH